MRCILAAAGTNRSAACSQVLSRDGRNIIIYAADCNILFYDVDSTNSSAARFLKILCIDSQAITSIKCEVVYNTGLSRSLLCLFIGYQSGAVWNVTLDWSSLEILHTIKVTDGMNSSIQSISLALFNDSANDELSGTLILAISSSSAILKILSVEVSLSPQLWEFSELSQIIDPSGTIPLCVEILKCEAKYTDLSSMLFIVGGTCRVLQIYGKSDNKNELDCKCRLAGMTDWTRFLALKETSDGFILANACQDCTISLWNINIADSKINQENSKLRKQYKFDYNHSSISIEHIALLYGHDDWISSLKWCPSNERLLSSSADSTLAIWEFDPHSGTWYMKVRLGELVAFKGATSATGSTGGFYGAFWLSDSMIGGHGRSGSWWFWDLQSDASKQKPTISGHFNSVTDISFNKSKNLLLSVSADQTSRIWKFDAEESLMVERMRPQIHGYDINAAEFLDDWTFASAGDEKALRIFRCPKALAEQCFPDTSIPKNLPSNTSASVPLLGLSNKAVEDGSAHENESNSSNEFAPIEEILGSRTLWPEIEKVYAHGYELNALACSNNGRFIVTACKSLNAEHAKLQAYDFENRKLLRSTSLAHSSTVHRIAFSKDDKYILAVSKDRKWSIHNIDDAQNEIKLSLLHSGHLRAVNDGIWYSLRSFVTASRDKSIKFWNLIEDEGSLSVEEYICKEGLQFSEEPAALGLEVTSKADQRFRLAVGFATGNIQIFEITIDSKEVHIHSSYSIQDAPKRRINRLIWKDPTTLLCAADDTSLRIFK